MKDEKEIKEKLESRKREVEIHHQSDECKYCAELRGMILSLEWVLENKK